MMNFATTFVVDSICGDENAKYIDRIVFASKFQLMLAQLLLHKELNWQIQFLERVFFFGFFGFFCIALIFLILCLGIIMNQQQQQRILKQSIIAATIETTLTKKMLLNLKILFCNNKTTTTTNDDDNDEIFFKIDSEQWFEAKSDRLWESRTRLLKTCFELRNHWNNVSAIEDNTESLKSTCLRLLEAAKLDGYRIGSTLLIDQFPLAVAINLSLRQPTSPEKLFDWYEIVGSTIANVVDGVFPTCSYPNRIALRYQIDTFCRLFQFAQLHQPFVNSNNNNDSFSSGSKSTITIEWALQLHMIEMKQSAQLLDYSVEFFEPFLRKLEIDYLNRFATAVVTTRPHQSTAIEYQRLLEERNQLLRDIESIHNHNQRLLYLVRQQQITIEIKSKIILSRRCMKKTKNFLTYFSLPPHLLVESIHAQAVVEVKTTVFLFCCLLRFQMKSIDVIANKIAMNADKTKALSIVVCQPSKIES